MVTPNCYMSCVDIKAAYRTVSIHPDHWDFQGISWNYGGVPTYLKDTRLCFGLRCAPYIFTQISRFVVNCMARRGFYNVVGYIDDFWVTEKTFDDCCRAQIALISLLRDLGFSVNWGKCISPSTKVQYLGIIFDSDRMTLSLPEKKLTDVHRELQFFLGRHRATKHQIQRLCGVLAHAAKVIYGGRTFSRRIINLLKPSLIRTLELSCLKIFGWIWIGGWDV